MLQSMDFLNSETKEVLRIDGKTPVASNNLIGNAVVSATSNPQGFLSQKLGISAGLGLFGGA